MGQAYYNDIDPFCCSVLRKQVGLGNLPDGVVDERSIVDVTARDLEQYRQVHLFAGIGGIPYGFRLAGVPDDLSVWSFGFPCQDISNAGHGAGLGGSRSGLFWIVMDLLDSVSRKPDFLFVENVAALRTVAGDRVLRELEERGYACFPSVVGAWAAGARHKRDRSWIVAVLADPGRAGREGGVTPPPR